MTLDLSEGSKKKFLLNLETPVFVSDQVVQYSEK